MSDDIYTSFAKTFLQTKTIRDGGLGEQLLGKHVMNAYWMTMLGSLALWAVTPFNPIALGTLDAPAQTTALPKSSDRRCP